MPFLQDHKDGQTPSISLNLLFVRTHDILQIKVHCE